MHEGGGDQQALPLTARQRCRSPHAENSQFESTFGLRDCRGADSTHAGLKSKIFPDGQLIVEAKTLRYVTDPLLRTVVPFDAPGVGS